MTTTQKPPTKYQRMKALRANLHWMQMMVRMDQRALASSREAVKKIAAELRVLQKEQGSGHSI